MRPVDGSMMRSGFDTLSLSNTNNAVLQAGFINSIERIMFNAPSNGNMTIQVYYDQLGSGFPFNGEVVEGIESEAKEHGYSVILANSNADPAQEIKAVDNFSERRVDGILVASSRVGAVHGKRLAGTKLPIVLPPKDMKARWSGPDWEPSSCGRAAS